MSKTLAFFDRFVVFLLGLLLLLAGLLPAAMYWDIPYVSDYVDRLNRGELAELPNRSWYTDALLATAVALFLLGLWFVLANIRSRAFSNRSIEAADPEHGETIINVQRLGDAACAALTQSEAVQKADCRTAVERERPTATFTVTDTQSVGRVTFGLGALSGDVELANIRVQEGGVSLGDIRRADALVADALAVLLARLHLTGFFWGDVSLSNTLFRRDAGAFSAYLVDAETGELHDSLSTGQREHDLELAQVNIAGEMMDLAAAGVLPEELDPIEVSHEIIERYRALWQELTGDEWFGVGERWRVDERIRRLNVL